MKIKQLYPLLSSHHTHSDSQRVRLHARSRDSSFTPLAATADFTCALLRSFVMCVLHTPRHITGEEAGNQKKTTHSVHHSVIQASLHLLTPPPSEVRAHNDTDLPVMS